jgi:UDP-N-acetyl-D-glucosamine dehydrogenase
MAMFAHQLDVDVWKAIDAATTKPFGFLPFQPGPGVGGHRLPVGPGGPSWRTRRFPSCDFRLAGLASDLNDHMPDSSRCSAWPPRPTPVTWVGRRRGG